MKERIDFDREFDASIYEKRYFDGDGGTSAYTDYRQAQGIVEEQYLVVNNLMSTVVSKPTALDIGTAYGFGADYLARQSWENVHGIDISNYAISKAKQLAAKSPAGDKLAFSQGDLLDTAVFDQFTDKQFGLVVGTELLEHIPSSEARPLLERVSRIAEWGFFVINARTSARIEAEEGIEHAKNDAGHLNHNSMSWWLKQFSYVGDIDFDLMFQFGLATVGKQGVDWHTRCVIVKFNEVDA